MTSLKSLAITDMPDRPEFLEEFPCLGLGILSRYDTLQEFDIWLTNWNRPNYYCDTWQERVTIEDEAFVTPETLDWFLGWLFPRSPKDLIDECRQKYTNFRDTIFHEKDSAVSAMPLLKLEKLRLRHIDLPSYAFQEVFDGQKLRELSLAFCDVDSKVWQTIGTTQLLSLANVDYDLVSQDLLRFLAAQSSLESISFARPADKCIASDFVLYPGEDSVVLNMQMAKRTPMLGQGTVWGQASLYGQDLARSRGTPYPTLEHLLGSISGAKVKELHIPADMYDITPSVMRMISKKLTYLEHISWGFNYDSLVSLAIFLAIRPIQLLTVHRRQSKKHS